MLFCNCFQRFCFSFHTNLSLCLEYEIAFGKIAVDGTLRYEDILKYFAQCGHNPSDKEADDAIAMVTNGTYQLYKTQKDTCCVSRDRRFYSWKYSKK